MTQTSKSAAATESLEDIELPVTVVVGRFEMSLGELSEWGTDTIVALGVKTSDPLELCVNGRTVATGELCAGEGGEGALAVRILDIHSDAADA